MMMICLLLITFIIQQTFIIIIEQKFQNTSKLKEVEQYLMRFMYLWQSSSVWR